MLQAFNDGDVDGVIAAFDERCELSEPSEVPDTPARGFRGHDGIRSWMENLRDVGGIRFEPMTFETRGEVIVTEWVGRGVGQGSGAPFEWRTFAVVHVRDGKILRAQGPRARPGVRGRRALTEVMWEPLSRNAPRAPPGPGVAA